MKTRSEKRFDNFLKRVLQNPGHRLTLEPKKGMSSKEAIFNERRTIVIRVSETLDLMGIKHSLAGLSIKVQK